MSIHGEPKLFAWTYGIIVRMTGTCLGVQWRIQTGDLVMENSVIPQVPVKGNTAGDKLVGQPEYG